MLNPALPWWAFIARAALPQSGVAIIEAVPCAIGKNTSAITAMPKIRRHAES